MQAAHFKNCIRGTFQFPFASSEGIKSNIKCNSHAVYLRKIHTNYAQFSSIHCIHFSIDSNCNRGVVSLDEADLYYSLNCYTHFIHNCASLHPAARITLVESLLSYQKILNRRTVQLYNIIKSKLPTHCKCSSE